MQVHTMGNSGDLNDEQARAEALKSFDETRSGVKGVVDSGITSVPSIFVLPPDARPSQPPPATSSSNTIPTIDLAGATDPNSRSDIVKQVKEASETWGFFQVVNHGIPISVLNNTLRHCRRFFELEDEVKKQYYRRDKSQPFAYFCNSDLYRSTRKAVDWRDSMMLRVKPNPPSPESLPEPCRELLEEEYPEKVFKLGSVLFELWSEGLGLKTNHLKEIGCEDGLLVFNHYYPACPQPELVIGTSQHADNDFMTVLLQDKVGGLQILHDDQWVDVPPIPGALVINIGDLLQLVTNDKFKSAIHRVLVNQLPRVSTACFFTTGLEPNGKMYGPIEELLSKDNPARYRETTIPNYRQYHINKGFDGKCALSYLKI